MTDFAKRANDMSYKMNPIVRSLLDQDTYKLTMNQFMWEKYPNVLASFKVNNRSKAVCLADCIDYDELKRQLDYVKSLKFTKSELIWLRGQTFYGQEGVFTKEYIDHLRAFKMSDYNLSIEDGEISLSFSGLWWQTSMWEIFAMIILNELRYRSVMNKMSNSELDIMYARAKVKLYNKLELIKDKKDLNFSDFGTRRRHSFLWQEHCVLTAQEILGDGFKGTSNLFLAMKHGLEAIGSNGHEMPMVFAAISGTDDDLKQSQYKVLKEWQTRYNENMLVFLPDTFGTTQFLNDAPQWISYWKGARPDSKEPIAAGNELISYWKQCGFTDEQIARDKMIIFSDGLDILPDSKKADVIDIYDHFYGKVQIAFGVGTKLTNDFIDCAPNGIEGMEPISIVCKVYDANNHRAVKLSDVGGKETGSAEEIERYRNVFGSDGVDFGTKILEV